MPELGFGSLLGVAAIAFLAPLVLALVPRVPVPPVVLELLAGILVGPQVLGLLEVDDPVAVLSLLGLAALLFLAGLEIDARELRGPALRVAAGAFGISLVLAVLVGLALRAAGVVEDAVFVAIVLSATSLGVVVPVLKDAGVVQQPLGQLVIIGASIADVATIVLLSLLFSTQSGSATAQAVLLGGLFALAVATAATVRLAGRSMRLGAALERLMGTTAEIRVRGAVLLLVAFVALAQASGLEVILGAFVAGLVLGTIDPDGAMRRPEFRAKLQAVGFGLLIPVFFVASGLRYDLDALLADTGALLLVPLFLAALLLVRGLPAVLLRGELEPGQWRVAGLLSATTLPFVVASTQIGLELELLTPATAAALVAAGLLSVLLLPATALVLLRRGAAVSAAPPAP